MSSNREKKTVFDPFRLYLSSGSSLRRRFLKKRLFLCVCLCDRGDIMNEEHDTRVSACASYSFPDRNFLPLG